MNENRLIWVAWTRFLESRPTTSALFSDTKLIHRIEHLIYISRIELSSFLGTRARKRKCCTNVFHIMTDSISFPEPIISLRMLDQIIWLWGSLKFPALWLVFKTTKKLTGQTQVKAQKSFLYTKKAIAYHRLSFNEMFASKPNLFSARFIAKRSSNDNRNLIALEVAHARAHSYHGEKFRFWTSGIRLSQSR